MDSEDGRSFSKRQKRKTEIEIKDEDPRKKKLKGDSGDRNIKAINGDEELPVQKVEKHITLGDVLQDMDDLSEPACMDRILMYYEEKRDEDYYFMELLVDRLKDEKITWEQPWYQQTNSLSRPLNSIDNENHSERYRTDPISKAESIQIKENWNQFIKLYNIPDKLICFARWRNKVKSRLPHTPEECARRFVVAFLARGLQRTLFHVFRHVMTHYGGPVKGAYSADEEKIMKLCFMHHPNNSVVLLSVVLGREPRGLYGRLQELLNGKPAKKKIKWTLALASRFLRLLLKYTQLPLEELKYRKIDKPVWLKLGNKFDHNYLYLQRFWYSTLHVQIFVKENLKINKLRKKVFKSLKSSSYQVWTDIRWKVLVQQFSDGMTHIFLNRITREVIQKIPGYLTKPLSEIAEQSLYILKNHRYRKRCLRTLRLNEDGDLEEVRYDS